VIGARADIIPGVTAPAIARPGVVRELERTAPARDETVTALGRVPELSIVAGLGLVALAVADTASRLASGIGEPLFWLGYVLIVAPIAARLLGTRALCTERIGLLLLLGLALILAKVLHDPVAVTFTDEFTTWRNVQQIGETGRLFTPNPLLPAPADYPGLQSAIAGLMAFTGIPFSVAGALVIGAGRLVMMLALYFFFEEAIGSPRAASIAAAVYALNPNFLFFGAQVAYESLALPFAMLALCLVAAARRRTSARAVILMALAMTSIVATVITHHLTSVGLAAFLVAWTVVAALRPSSRQEAARIAPVALFALVACVTWSLYMAGNLVDYLVPVLSRAWDDLVAILTGARVTRELFRYTVEPPPSWEQLLGYGSVLIVLVLLPFGLWRIARAHLDRPLLVTLGLASLLYPAALVMRLTAAGAETANRSSEFLFLAIGAVVAVGIAEVLLARPSRPRIALITAALTAAAVGGVIVGWARWARLPGPYLVAADTRSIERTGVEVASWTATYLGPGNRFVTDRTNRSLVGIYGSQRPVTGFNDLMDTKALILSPQLGAEEKEIASEGLIRYVEVDRRLASSLPYGGIYVERGELDVHGPHTSPLPIERLDKFEGVPTISRIFDSGDIRIYDVERWWSE
jgi:hypothetical protein